MWRRNLLASILIVTTIFSWGCASTVRFDYVIPSLEKDTSRAIVTEMNAKKNRFILSKIQGFYVGRSAYPEKLEEPYSQDSETMGVAKILYSMTPLGLATHAVHVKKGRVIAIPPGEVGVLIRHNYYREIGREAVFKIEKAGYKIYGSSNGPADSFFRLVMEVGDTIDKVTYLEHQWDDVVWAKVEADNKYKVDLSANKLLDAENTIIAGNELAMAEEPDNPKKGVALQYVRLGQYGIKELDKFLGTRIISQSEDIISIIGESEDSVITFERLR